MIRKAISEDIDSLVLISYNSFKNSPWGANSFEAEFAKYFSCIHVYVDKTRIVAYIVTWVIRDEGEIVSLAVEPASRQRGIADKLLKFIFKKYAFVEKWYLEVSSANYAALNLYKKYAFKKKRAIKDYYGQGQDAFFMSSDHHFTSS